MAIGRLPFCIASRNQAPLSAIMLPAPRALPVIDTSGSLYGNTCTNGAFGFGAIFKLAPTNGGWTYTSLHDFTEGDDGAWPAGV
jgi:uncharacterized repeat protein (TIGR03803 family)